MSGRPPDQIWTDSLDEGERRLRRGWTALAATGFAGGVDVFFSIVALAVASAALQAAMPEPTAHLLASLTFGIGFVFITLGRAELFTENFLVPVAAVVSKRGTLGALLRMWVITLTLNFVGLALFAAIFAVSGVLKADTLEAPARWRTRSGARGASGLPERLRRGDDHDPVHLGHRRRAERQRAGAWPR
jgi:formate/nitrite transporter FocA (FNT family)